MSTTTNHMLQENTIGKEQNNKENNMYLYGRSGTDIFSTKDPEIKPRSSRTIEAVAYTNNKLEEIKQVLNGVVTDFNDNELTAELEDLTNPENPNEEVTLSIEEIDNRDLPLIQKGATFLWHIGYRTGQKQSKERFSKISFRRLPNWTAEEIQDAKKLAEKYSDFFQASKVPHTIKKAPQKITSIDNPFILVEQPKTLKS